MKFALVILIVGAVLVKDALSASAEANSVPLLRKFSRNKGDASAEVESRGLFSINKPAKRPTSANVIFITSPSGPSDSEESAPSSPPSEPPAPPEPSWPSWPSWPYWPLHSTKKPSTTTTTTTTPKPETKPPHLPPGDYPHYLPYLPPLLLPIPGWTGNPPPPFIHPSYQNRPHQQWPQWPQPPPWTPSPSGTDDQSPTAPGTPTLATDDEIVIRDEVQDKDKNEGGLLWIPLQQDLNVNGLSPEILASLMGGNRKPEANKKPRPNRRRPVTPSPFDVDAINKRKPRPTRRQGPVKKLIVGSPEDEQLPQMRPDNRRKPKPSRKPKPKPSAKPTQVTAKPEAAVAAEISSEIPNTTVAAMPPAAVSTESPTRKKTPTTRPSRKPMPATQAPAIAESMTGTRTGPVRGDKVEGDQPQKKDPQSTPVPEPMSAGNPEESEQLPVPQITGDIDQAVATKPESEEPDLNSTEFLGPDEDLIVVQRQGKPMDAQRVESGEIPPWQLLKLPRGADWELGPQLRYDSREYFFNG